jgi:FHS family L-fucose permease-like MFS transporter
MTSDIANHGLGMDATIAGFVVGTYWFLMMIGRIVGASLGAKFSSKAMLSVAAGLGLVFVFLGIMLPATITINMPVFQSNLSFGWAEVPVGIAFWILCGLCTSVMWGGIFNLAVEGLGKYTEAASGLFMVMVCGGGIIPLIQGQVADMSNYTTSYWVMFLCMGYMLFYALIGSKNVNKNIPV